MLSSIKDMAALRWKLLARIVSVLVVPISLWTISKWLLSITGVTVWGLSLLGITLVVLVLEVWAFFDIAGLKKELSDLKGSVATPVDVGEEKRELRARLSELPSQCRGILRTIRLDSRRTIELHNDNPFAEVLFENDVFEYASYDDPHSTWRITDRYWAVLEWKKDWGVILRDNP